MHRSRGGPASAGGGTRRLTLPVPDCLDTPLSAGILAHTTKVNLPNRDDAATVPRFFDDAQDATKDSETAELPPVARREVVIVS